MGHFWVDDLEIISNKMTRETQDCMHILLASMVISIFLRLITQDLTLLKREASLPHHRP